MNWAYTSRFHRWVFRTGPVFLWLASIDLPAAVSDPNASVLPQGAYVWQRVWNAPVTKALTEHGLGLGELIILKEEISFERGQPKPIRVPADLHALMNLRSNSTAASPPSIGLALRIGPFSGPFDTDDVTAMFICDEADWLVRSAKADLVQIAELQVDFDCADSKLEGYSVWVKALRKRIAPVPLTITVLPSWLKQDSFPALIAASDGYVLQVHSVERPRDINAPFTLCDPAKARKAVELAGSFQLPFRVALPTYGYQVAYDASGRLAGLAAEGSVRRWPADTQLREVRSNPFEIAGLVQHWTTNHPPAMKGILWYRFPVSGDILNWRWPTLAAIMAARSPTEKFRAEPRRVETGLVEISLVNNGELDISSRLAVEVHWPRDNAARLVAADGLLGFRVVDGGISTLQLKTESQSFRLPAGESRVIGWLRFDQDREVKVEARKF